MAFTDLLDLRTAVIEHVQRPDIADVFPRLVLLAEANFNRRLRLKDQITSTSVTIASGVAALPADFLAVIGLYDTNGHEYIEQPIHAVKTSGTTHYYAISGGSIVTKIADGSKTLEYYAKVPTISGSMTATNWLLTAAPALYLYGVGLEAAKYIRDVNMAQATAQILEDEYAAVLAQDDSARYSAARVRVQGTIA